MQPYLELRRPVSNPRRRHQILPVRLRGSQSRLKSLIIRGLHNNDHIDTHVYLKCSGSKAENVKFNKRKDNTAEIKCINVVFRV